MYLAHQGPFSAARNWYFNRVLRRFCNMDGARLLDYGCGPGDMLLACKLRGIDATGVDNSDYSLHLATSRDLKVIKGDYHGLPFEPASFDVIFMQSVIEHMHDPVEALSRLKTYLKSGGRMVVSAPTPEDGFWDDPTHVRPHTPKSMLSLAELCGLKVEYLSYVFSFLLGLELRSSLFYKVLNRLPLPLGSNLLCVYRKPT